MKLRLRIIVAMARAAFQSATAAALAGKHPTWQELALALLLSAAAELLTPRPMEKRVMNETKAPQDELLTTDELAARLRVTSKSLRRWVSEGKVPCIRASGRGRLRFSWEAVCAALGREATAR